MDRRPDSSNPQHPGITPLLQFLTPIRLRRRWANCASVALLLGITTGVSMLAIAGARRTQSSYDQFLRATNASTLSVALPFAFSWDMNQQIAALDGVKSSRTYVSLAYAFLTDGRIDFPRSLTEPLASVDGAYFDQDRFVAREGRVPDPGRVDEIAVNEFAAAQSGFRVGDRVELALYGPLQPLDPNSATQPVPLRTIEVEVVGIGSFPEEILQDEADRTARLLITPAFTAGNLDAVTFGLQYLQLDRASAEAEAVQARLREVDSQRSLDVRLTSVDQARGGARCARCRSRSPSSASSLASSASCSVGKPSFGCSGAKARKRRCSSPSARRHARSWRHR